MSVNKRSTPTGITANVRAELARQGLSIADLAPVIGKSEATTYRRMQGAMPFTTDEIELIAAYLDVPLSILFASKLPAQAVA